jgi:hypothetical protein
VYTPLCHNCGVACPPATGDMGSALCPQCSQMILVCSVCTKPVKGLVCLLCVSYLFKQQQLRRHYIVPCAVTVDITNTCPIGSLPCQLNVLPRVDAIAFNKFSYFVIFCTHFADCITLGTCSIFVNNNRFNTNI